MSPPIISASCRIVGSRPALISISMTSFKARILVCRSTRFRFMSKALNNRWFRGFGFPFEKRGGDSGDPPTAPTGIFAV